MDVDARVRAAQQEHQRLRDRIEVLEAAMGMDFLAPLEWGLTGKEGAAFGVLLARDHASKQQIMTALYGDMDEPEIKIVDVFICKMRKKLKPFAIEIETVWGVGYRLSPEAKTKARAYFPAIDD